MGNLIKINIYADRKKSDNKQINMSILEDSLIAYDKWLEKTNRVDIIENYKKFLMIG
ncbi:hypothetical protein [Clostridium uliginosum]|uniref:Uncharacterized protein n=1 Tax=Clostridium uliginosum TaxID=119641 RepID=A0A1I1PNR5_9CLOT|nr:hypothetical protein [Clostridium uliginosum]SFD11461.1 hypothetical protein SAMN05421842_12038 [Clostridium uliginosum]